jgi:hypothetical protein
MRARKSVHSNHAVIIRIYQDVSGIEIIKDEKAKKPRYYPRLS